MISVLREAKATPADVAARVARAGGDNRFGEPNFRVVWGWTRLGWVGGEWEVRDASGNLIRRAAGVRLVPLHTPHDRWHIERWLPPEQYGPMSRWASETTEQVAGQRVPQLGPFPQRGDYEHCFTLSGPNGEFVPLTPAVCEHIVRAIEWSRAQPASAGRAALDRREAARSRAWHRAAESALGL